jgi:hypothetical protein
MTTSSLSALHPDFDTLILSRDRILFDQMTDYLRKNDFERTLKLSRDLSDLQPIDVWLGKCDIMICDLRFDYSLLEMASMLVEAAPMHLLGIGIINGPQLLDNALALPACVRLADVVSMQDGWKGIWHHISRIKYAWSNPLMMSKIEDVPVSDILQMIAIGRWNSMVQIHGRSATGIEPTKKNNDRVRGSIFFWNGEPLAAWSSFHTGVEAVCDLLSLKQGILTIIRPFKAPPFRNIKTDMQDILISHAVNLDETLRQQASSPNSLDRADDAPLSCSPPSNDVGENSKNNTEKSESDAPSSILNPWWSQNFSALNDAIVKAEPRSLPLRWMKAVDLEKLTQPNSQSAFLVLRAPQEFLLQMLGLCARDVTADKLDKGWIPVLRLGRQQRCYLYLACLETNAACPHLSSFPCAVYSPQEHVSNTILSLATCGHPVGIFLLPDGEEMPQTDLVNERSEPFIRSIPAPLLRWDSITQTLVKILTTLSDIASGGSK